ncbi:hybrid sensor histidine kinase/response regulator transcription factor [Nibrella saemangeumensis]|uniref:histidine kinase n=1 Tax=Nibrella saemangeumensis TaxID=1084526 RepID=A0ABP8NAJ7_9BACT
MAQPYTASVKHYGPEQGLSHREVNAIFQDKQGFMWFGTRFGLNRFDGLRFTTFTREKNGLDFDDVQAIAQDADGLIWLMGPNGQTRITLFNPLTNQAVSFEEKFKKKFASPPTDMALRLFGSADGTIFFTSHQPAVLVSYHPKTGLRQVSLPQFVTLTVERVTTRNTVWVIADNHILVELAADGRILQQFSHPKHVVKVCFGQANAGTELFYFAENERTGSGSFYSIDESGNRRELPFPFFKSLPQYTSPVCYAYDRNGLIWDGTHLRDVQKGVVLDVTGQTEHESITNRSFYRDRNGRFWLGTSFGIYQVRVSANHFHRLFYEASNQGEKVAAVRGIQRIGDEVYANLEKFGLYKSSRLGGTSQGLYEKKTFASIYGLSPSIHGKVYAGAKGQLIKLSLPAQANTSVPLPDGWIIWTFYPTNDKQLLAGGQGGLWVIQTSNDQIEPFNQYNQFTELATAHVLHIRADRQGTIWVCASTGLYTIDPGRGVTARYWSGGKGAFYLPAENYQHFYQDPEGVYWLATANSGLIRWDRRQNQFRQFRRNEGLSNDNIYAVYPDRQGHLWLSSDYGIMQFDPVRLTTRSYFVEDGITHNEFNRIAHHQDKDGRIYFGGLNGITAFDPRDFQTEKPAAGPPLRITSFRQYDDAVQQIVDRTEELITKNIITVEPDDRSSVLEFALLNYANAEKNVYAYQFRDIDTDWTYQTEPTLRLSNLPYGDHELLIKAQAADGRWSANTLKVTVTVLRPFYLRVWFLITLALLVGAGVWAWLRWRIWRHEAAQKRLETEIWQATARIAQDKEIIEQQAKALLQLNETKSRFFANISHEFRTPLTVILGMAAELEADRPENEAQKQRLIMQQAAGMIRRNGTNLLRLINQILDLSKLEAGEMQIKPVRADLVAFIRYVGESFHSMARARDIQLHFLSEEERCEADFDKDKLQDILTNLLSNALKFTPAGGHIYCQVKVRKEWSSLSAQGYYEELTPIQQADGPWIQISVSDTGPGIDPASLPNVFDRFYQVGPPSAGPRMAGPRQADMQTDSQTGGTGIGLSLVRELVLLMQGGLAVRNRLKNGAEFVVSLPLTRQAMVANEVAATPVLISPDRRAWAEPDPAAAEAKPVLLLVEDNEDVAIYIQTCVQADYQVIRAENGQAGIDLALEKMPDLIISDVMMPLKDGFALCNELKNDERTSHIPIVLLTARAAVDDRLTGLRRGADAYLVKPFLREELLVVLSNLLQTRRLLQIHYSQLALGGTPLGGTRPGVAPLGDTRLGVVKDHLAVTAEEDSMEDEFLRRLRTTVEAQLENVELSIDDICQVVGMSRATLHRKLTALTGLSISRYLRILRLRKAQELLSSPELNIAEVAYAVGFGDPRYFSRVFSEEFGVSPGSFRQSNQQ